MAEVRRRLFTEKESPWKYTQETWPSKHWKQSNFYSNLFSDTNWYQYTRADIFQRAMNDGYRERMMEEQRERMKEREEEENWIKWSAEREKKYVKELEEETERAQIQKEITELKEERENVKKEREYKMKVEMDMITQMEELKKELIDGRERERATERILRENIQQ